MVSASQIIFTIFAAILAVATCIPVPEPSFFKHGGHHEHHVFHVPVHYHTVHKVHKVPVYIKEKVYVHHHDYVEDHHHDHYSAPIIHEEPHYSSGWNGWD